MTEFFAWMRDCSIGRQLPESMGTKDRTFFFVTLCYIHSNDLSLVIYIGEKMIKQFEFGVINWYDLRDCTLDKSRRAYKSVQNIGWKKSGKVREFCYRKSLATLDR